MAGILEAARRNVVIQLNQTIAEETRNCRHLSTLSRDRDIFLPMRRSLILCLTTLMLVTLLAGCETVRLKGSATERGLESLRIDLPL